MAPFRKRPRDLDYGDAIEERADCHKFALVPCKCASVQISAPGNFRQLSHTRMELASEHYVYLHTRFGLRGISLAAAKLLTSLIFSSL